MAAQCDLTPETPLSVEPWQAASGIFIVDSPPVIAASYPSPVDTIAPGLNRRNASEDLGPALAEMPASSVRRFDDAFPHAASSMRVARLRRFGDGSSSDARGSAGAAP